MAFQIVSRDLYGLLGNALYRYIGGTFYWYKVLRFIYVLEEVYFRRPCSNNIRSTLDYRRASVYLKRCEIKLFLEWAPKSLTQASINLQTWLSLVCYPHNYEYLQREVSLNMDSTKTKLSSSILMAVFAASLGQFQAGYNLSVMNTISKIAFPAHTTTQWSIAVAAYAIGGPCKYYGSFP